MLDLVRLNLAVNDENGKFAGQASGLVWTYMLGEIVLQLEAGAQPIDLEVWGGNGLRLRSLYPLGEEAVHDCSFSFCNKWVGSMAWDQFGFAVWEASKLLAFLRQCGWVCVEAESSLFRAWEEGLPLNPSILEGALRRVAGYGTH
jgi:hypothetical protein